MVFEKAEELLAELRHGSARSFLIKAQSLTPTETCWDVKDDEQTLQFWNDLSLGRRSRRSPTDGRACP